MSKRKIFTIAICTVVVCGVVSVLLIYLGKVAEGEEQAIDLVKSASGKEQAIDLVKSASVKSVGSYTISNDVEGAIKHNIAIGHIVPDRIIGWSAKNSDEHNYHVRFTWKDKPTGTLKHYTFQVHVPSGVVRRNVRPEKQPLYSQDTLTDDLTVIDLLWPDEEGYY